MRTLGEMTDDEATEAMEVTEERVHEEAAALFSADGTGMRLPLGRVMNMVKMDTIFRWRVRSRCFSLRKRRNCLSPRWQKTFIEKRVNRRERLCRNETLN